MRNLALATLGVLLAWTANPRAALGADIKEAVERGTRWLSAHQNPDGG